jgi:predicted Rossmann fold nucleotide-binding protein DprA/Smf involved in DNA uptake
MKEFEVALKAVVDGMRTLAQGVEKLAGKLEASVPNGKAKAKPVRKAAAKPKKAAPKKTVKKKASASDTVLTIINRSKKGVNSDTLAEKTGFDKKKIANIVFRLRKTGKIKSLGRGVYTKM